MFRVASAFHLDTKMELEKDPWACKLTTAWLLVSEYMSKRERVLWAY